MSEIINYLERLDFYNEEVFTRLELKSALLEKETSNLILSFKSESPLKIENIKELKECLDSKNLKGIKKTIYSFSFDSYSESDVCSYYDQIIKDLSSTNQSLVKAISYTKSLDGSELTIEYPTSDVSFTFERNRLLSEFRKYGFNDLTLKFKQVEDAYNIEHLINETRSEIIDNTNKSLNRVTYRYMSERELSGNDIKLENLPNDEESFSLFSGSGKTRTVIVKGYICYYDKDTFDKNGKVKFIVTDGKNYIALKRTKLASKEEYSFFNDMKLRMYVECQAYPDIYQGIVSYKVVNMKYRTDIMPITDRKDEENKKRVELHLHTKMSALDGVNSISEYMEAAEIFNHKALAITDHNTVQSFHDFFEYKTKDPDFKKIYGVELNYVDEDKAYIATNESDINLEDATYCVFDFETTGFSVNYEEIIEVSAVKIKDGVVIDTFSELINPHKEIHPTVVALTNIRNNDVKVARDREEVLADFRRFIEDTILVAHNAEFDLGHLYHNFDELNISYYKFPSVDTLILSKVLYPGHKKYTLDALCNLLSVTLNQHHRALEDAKATADIFIKMLDEVKSKGVYNHKDLNSLINKDERYKLLIPKHINLLAKTQEGLTNLYHILSLAGTEYFTSECILTKNVLEKYREGILVGSGCRNSHFFEMAFNKSSEELEKIIDFYDYIEIQSPLSFTTYNNHMFESDFCVKDTIKKIISLAEKHSIPVVATGDTHQVNKEDQIYRNILVTTDPQKGSRSHYLKWEKDIPYEYYKTTKEMLDEFSFLGEAKAYEVVVENSNLIADSIDKVEAFNNRPLPPKDDFMKDYGIPSAESFVKEEVLKKASSFYGELLPGMVFDRIESELSSILENKFSTIYLISKMLVKKSRDDGYVVGSRGSVGSSFVAYLMEITEVNSLPPHYICPKCHYSAFKMNPEEKKKYGIRHDEECFQNDLDNVSDGYDLKEATCPVCGSKLKRDGHDIPFETFLGVKEDPKTPDIDLNFSGDNQSQIHDYIRELFGETKAFRAGTVITCADKTSFAIVRDYFDFENERRAKEGLASIKHHHNEIEALSTQITGSKKTSSQHPGGIVVVPKDHEIYEVTPIQYPGDAKDRSWMTTHFEYHNFEKNLFKLDVLGQDDPTVLRYLMDLVKKNPSHFPFDDATKIPVDDSNIYKLMSGTEVIGVSPQDIMSTIASYGISEFGTSFVRGLLEKARPESFADLLKVSGLSHGTDVWTDNAEALLLGNNQQFPKIKFSDLIGCRDDIMLDLINYGVPSGLAFKIMEFVRKGNAPKKPDKWNEFVEKLKEFNVPEWFIWSCSKIKYMFPKAHATAYTIMALRIAWFKIYRPIYFYSAVLSKKKDKFDIETMMSDISTNKMEIERLRSLSNDDKDSNTKDLLTAAELSLEMKVRGYKFLNVDLYHSEAHDFKISDDEKAMYLPFIAVDGLGPTVAESIVREREIKPFSTKKDFQDRTRCSKTIMKTLEDLGVFKDMPDDAQLTLDLGF